MVATTAPQAVVSRRVETMAVATLPPFSNQRGCPRCGARYEIRVHFDRDCAEVRGGDISTVSVAAGTSGSNGAA